MISGDLCREPDVVVIVEGGRNAEIESDFKPGGDDNVDQD